MHAVVSIKQVPDTETRIRIAPDGNAIVEADVNWIVSPYDEFAIEEALRIKEKKGGEVVLVTAGPDRAQSALRTGLAMGADAAVHVKDPLVDGADSMGTARALAAAIKTLAPFDLVLGAFAATKGLRVAGRGAVDSHYVFLWLAYTFVFLFLSGRVLDSKREQDAALVEAAPKIAEFWSHETADHFEAVCSGLQALGVPYTLAPRLVRGLDYYRRTTFEFASDALESAQNAVGGGGRYDGLAEDLGGAPTPGIGFALGLDRTLLACDLEGAFPAPDLAPQVFVVDTTGGREALIVTNELRAAGLRADRAFENRSMKSQMKAADRSGAAIAVIIGTNERDTDTVVVRRLRHGGEQTVIPRVALLDTVRKQLEQ